MTDDEKIPLTTKKRLVKTSRLALEKWIAGKIVGWKNSVLTEKCTSISPRAVLSDC